MLYPGLGLGAIVSRARRISNGMLAAAANAISSLVAVRLPGASLLPYVDNLRSVSLTVALAVAETALEEGPGRRRARRHRAAGARRHVATGVLPAPSILTLPNDYLSDRSARRREHASSVLDWVGGADAGYHFASGPDS